MPFTIIAGPAAKTTTDLIAEIEAAGVWLPGISPPPSTARRLRLVRNDRSTRAGRAASGRRMVDQDDAA